VQDKLVELHHTGAAHLEAGVARLVVVGLDWFPEGLQAQLVDRVDDVKKTVGLQVHCRY
jgi:hypothetical protein